MPGRKTKNPLNAKVTIRLPAEVLAAMSDLAARQHRSLNGEIVHALEDHLAAIRQAELAIEEVQRGQQEKH